MRTVAVLGDGAWGSAMAIHLAGIGFQARLWSRDPERSRAMARSRSNERHLPGVVFPEAISPCHELAGAVDGVDLVFCALPAQHARPILRRLHTETELHAPVLIGTKGIEAGSLALPLAVARQELGNLVEVAVLSGPSFAAEVARARPTAVVVAAAQSDLASRLQREIAGPRLRLYTTPDEVGVQIAGALKNVIAVAAGIADGLGLGSNAVAALITRGLAEMTRLGVALGGRERTFSGLAGLGDLVLTCTGALSRNHAVGLAIGRGDRLSDTLARSASIAEGVFTARAAVELARSAEVQMPIVDEVAGILFDRRRPAAALESLLARALTAEED